MTLTSVLVGFLALAAVSVVTGYGLLWAAHAEWWRPSTAARAIAAQSALVDDPADPQRPIETLHPYVGYVLNPDARPQDWVRSGNPRPVVNRYGFEGNDWSVRPEPGVFRVAVTGGSVAKALCMDSGGVLKRALRAALQVNDADGVELVCLALGGFKQPQQAMAVSYFLALGHHFDAVINLDGFNEVALYAVDDPARSICPSFPRVWYGRSEAIPDREHLVLTARVLGIEAERGALARTGSARLGRYHPLAYWSWRERDTAAVSRLAAARDALRRHVPPARTALNAGLFAGTNLPEPLGHIWASGSRHLHAVCSALGVGYFHFLQPNQYVPHSKPMGAAEQAAAFDAAHPYRSGVELGYPVLQEQGALLVRDGVRFADLTQVFASHASPLYIDTCCHLNVEGNCLLAEAIASHVRAAH